MAKRFATRLIESVVKGKHPRDAIREGFETEDDLDPAALTDEEDDPNAPSPDDSDETDPLAEQRRKLAERARRSRGR